MEMGTGEQQPAFEQLLGRVPSARERERLLRLQKALELRDDDAMWAVAVILQDYDAAVREELERVHEVLKATRVELARNNHLVRELAARSCHAATPAPRPLSSRGVLVATSGVALVAFGALCINVGYTLGSRGVPEWLGVEESRGGQVMAAILRAPAGWLLLVPLMGVAAYLTHEAIRTMRERTGGLRGRLIAWSLLVLAAFGAVAVGGVLASLM
ncbi:hypothetical protein OWM54_43060 [Myxococcus sp. MISCRS1]|uniref:hypothetical protein n=1 Tax=Myxococcus sp. MISCRS1 TaxID=2996786 RepID=UPI0022709484|nr:hypothetical protein [Myxococcus sp. MISCRS1]MCY1003946.1 hypothetical protein [Myxococcus sp. MISCRS1]